MEYDYSFSSQENANLSNPKLVNADPGGIWWDSAFCGSGLCLINCEVANLVGRTLNTRCKEDPPHSRP